MENLQPKPQGDDAETPTQKQARLRRERREAKLKADGTSRLEKIAKVSGRQNLPGMDPLTISPPQYGNQFYTPILKISQLTAQLATDPPPNIGKVSDDPDEVNLSTNPSAARTPNLPQERGSSTNGPPTEADIRAMLRAGAPQPGAEQEAANVEEDPMMKMLSQLMGGIPGGENGAGEPGEGGLPPGLAAMLGAGGMPGMSDAPAGRKEDTYAYLWKIVHAVFALCLGMYVTATSMAFSGSIRRGIPEAVSEEMPEREGVNLFFVFATMELVLQSSRFLLEKGNSGGQLGGWIGLVAGFLPEPYRGYVMLMGRHARIWGTVVEDAMVIVFVVGCVAWWEGAVGMS